MSTQQIMKVAIITLLAMKKNSRPICHITWLIRLIFQTLGVKASKTLNNLQNHYKLPKFKHELICIVKDAPINSDFLTTESYSRQLMSRCNTFGTDSLK